MNVREATENDIPQIVEVLKASLGEKDLSLSDEIYRYKHIDNKFGKSIVLIAEEEKKIVGVRAFMRWKWQNEDNLYVAYRAVDTATLPSHQGKGIFKKLTLAAVDIARDSGDQFIFNTPNEKSRPGYLKMGWEPVGKIEIGIKPSLGFLSFNRKSGLYQIQDNSTHEKIDRLCSLWNKKLSKSRGIFTPKSRSFLEWRYQENPLQDYTVIIEESYYIAAYVKNRGRVRELRIAEFIFDDSQFRSKDLRKVLKGLEKKFSAHLMSFSPKLLELRGKKGNFGPLLVLNDLNLVTKDKLVFTDISNWYNSIGDLELF